MSSRGAIIRYNRITTDEYEKIDEIYDADILIGRKNHHGLPDYSHSPEKKYIKLNPDGSFREMRFYGPNGEPILEIGYHPEPNINNGNRMEKVLHYHVLITVSITNIERGPAVKLHSTDEIYIKYKKYLEVYGL